MPNPPSGVINTYNSYVLEGAWAEDRSGLPPAPGGIPDLGYRLYNSEAKDTYKPVDLSQELTFPRYKPRYGMLTKDTWNEASYSYAQGPEALKRVLLGGKKAFHTTLAGRDMSKEEISATFTSTAREAAISGINVSSQASADAAKAMATLTKTSLMPAAGGAGAVFMDKGKRITGVSGEIVRESADARYDSQAQRSWIGRPDAGLNASKRPPAPRPEVTWMSPPGIGEDGSGSAKSPAKAQGATMHGRFAAYAAPGVVGTDISSHLNNPRPGRRVFRDDP